MGQEDSLVKGMATYSSVLAYRIPWTDEPGGLHTVYGVTIWGHKVKVKVGEGTGTPLQYPCLENPMDGGAWWAAVHGVAKSQTRLSNFTFTFKGSQSRT